MKILFLDIDGVLLTPLRRLIGTQSGVDLGLAFTISQICRHGQVKLVCISDRREDAQKCHALLADIGLSQHLHQDWKVCAGDSKLTHPRGVFLEEWLSRHPELNLQCGGWRALDDKPKQYLPKHERWVIACHPDTGITYPSALELVRWGLGIEGPPPQNTELPDAADAVL